MDKRELRGPDPTIRLAGDRLHFRVACAAASETTRVPGEAGHRCEERTEPARKGDRRRRATRDQLSVCWC